ncbi:hypothetical protein Hanom_Chr09g00793941 [Helianthus anomalus]
MDHLSIIVPPTEPPHHIHLHQAIITIHQFRRTPINQGKTPVLESNLRCH